MLDANAAFCAQCGAPQIGVTPAELEPEPAREVAEPGKPEVALSRRIDWSRAFVAVLVPALVASFILLVPLLNLAFFLWIGLAGAGSVFFYARRKPNAWIDSGVGARLGAVAGVLAYAIVSIFMAAGIALADRSGKSEYRNEFLRQFHDQAARNPDPHAMEIYNRLANNPEALAIVFVVMLVFLFVLFVGLGSVGGAIAGSQRRSRPRT